VRWSARATAAALAVVAVAAVWTQAAEAQSPQPAFYTSQAPGGLPTVGKKVIALTFDDGPGPYTPQVLSVLESYHVPATFFEIGENIVEYPQYTRMLAAAGYPVEDHTWTHPDLTTLPVSQFPYQIDQTQGEIRALTGETPTCVRPPYDAWNATVLDQIAQRGLTTMSYSLDPRDWSNPGVPAIVSAVVGGTLPGAVVDMHDGGGTREETVDALPQIISDLEAQGYTFVSICGSMAERRPQQSAVYGFGAAVAPGPSVTSNLPLVGASVSPGGTGYWLAAADGGLFAVGGAPFEGSLPGLGVSPAAPVDALASAVGAPGYWEVASDGGVFAFGDAGFYGSMGDKPLNQPVVGMAATPDGRGYWEVASDGGVFAFGDAGFYGSMGGHALDAPVVAMAADPATGGYWLAGADGGVFSFDAPFYGSRSGQDSSDGFFAICATSAGGGYLLAGEHPAP